MLINNRFDYQTLERETLADGTRYYLDPTTGQRLASVTTIIDATMDKKFLVEWEQRVGSKKAEEIRTDAAALGTLLHTHMECHIQEIPRPKGNNMIRQLAERMSDVIIEKGLSKVNEVWGYEIGLCFPGLFAGTTDLVGVYKGKPAIMDYKNTKKMKRRDMLDGYFSQLCAYSLAHNEMYGTDINTGVIFMVDRELNYEAFELTGADFKEHSLKFLNRVDEYLKMSVAA